MPRNVTLSLDEEVLRKARVAAAHRGVSVSALLRANILRIALGDDRYAAAKEAARRRLLRGHKLGGGKLPSRDDLHARSGRR